MSIRPLPDGVAAQIKSSTTIVSLTGVVLELLKNSLDAEASKVTVAVDFARGSCTIEDDGLGIPPDEFSEEGGLGKLYWTSKFHSHRPYLGQHGIFLASLSAVSLLTIASKHHAHRSQNLITFHHAQTIERQMPASAHSPLLGKHGTRVTVRNLFGNMPVRVKQRTLVADQRTEQQRLCQVLKREIVGLLLSSQTSILLKVRDGDNKTVASFNTSNVTVAGHIQGVMAKKPTSAHLTSLLQIMTQADYIAAAEWDSWVPVSASTPTVTVRGAISLDPAPNKNTQFISFGMRPLSSETWGNELYDQVNRLFALSDFGSVEDDDAVDEQEQLRRLADKRYKKEGFTNRQLKIKKGIDRCPMFHLRVSLRTSRTTSMMEDWLAKDESSLKAVIGVLTAVVAQWLSVHHFRPKPPADRPKAASASSYDSTKEAFFPSSKRQISPETPQRLAEKHTIKRPRSVTISQETSPGRPYSKAFAGWSRIKSGRQTFFEPLSTTQKPCAIETTLVESYQGSTNTDALLDSKEKPWTTADAYVEPIVKVAFGDDATAVSSKAGNETSPTLEEKDNLIPWTDLSTSKTYMLNGRTGCVMPTQRPRTSSEPLSPSGNRLNTNKSLRMTPRPATGEPAKTPWLDGVFHTWESPIFRPTEQRLSQITLQYYTDRADTGYSRHSRTCRSTFNTQEAFGETASITARLSKDGLSKAEVISQVDKKFILARMASSAVDSEARSTVDLLVLIDQHAADERIRVESLLNELCSPVHGSSRSSYRSKLGLGSPVDIIILESPLQFTLSPQEQAHFETFASSFAAWGILYDVSRAVLKNSRSSLTEVTHKLSVTALPPAISERCKADPQLLISFLRSAIWQYVESPPLALDIASTQHTSWVKRIGACPPGLVDLLNSRACRSAIMFNDELSLMECTNLVNKLAACMFPFICAHGRPSMVPIVDLGKVTSAGFTSEPPGSTEGRNFVDAWKKWKQ